MVRCFCLLVVALALPWCAAVLLLESDDENAVGTCVINETLCSTSSAVESRLVALEALVQQQAAQLAAQQRLIDTTDATLANLQPVQPEMRWLQLGEIDISTYVAPTSGWVEWTGYNFETRPCTFILRLTHLNLNAAVGYLLHGTSPPIATLGIAGGTTEYLGPISNEIALTMFSHTDNPPQMHIKFEYVNGETAHLFYKLGHNGNSHPLQVAMTTLVQHGVDAVDLYKVGEFGSAACPTGYVNVLTDVGCRSAHASMATEANHAVYGNDVNGGTPTSTWNVFPPGCFSATNGHFHFNSEDSWSGCTDACDSDARAVCILTTRW